MLDSYSAYQSLNHFSLSAPFFQDSGMRRTQSVEETLELVDEGSVKVRAGPVRVAVRAPSVNTALTWPSAPRSTERAGFSSRDQLSPPLSRVFAAPPARSEPSSTPTFVISGTPLSSCLRSSTVR